MFMMLMDAIAWLIVAALAYLALGLAGAALGAAIGNTMASVRQLWRKSRQP